MDKSLKLYSFNLLLLAMSWGCDRDEPINKVRPIEIQNGSSIEKKKVFTSTYVLQELVEDLVNSDQVDVNPIFTMTKEDPSLSEPSIKVINALQKADLIVLNGARFEQGLTTIDLPRAKVIKTAQKFKDHWLSYPKRFQAEHQHGPQGKHQHQGIDGHTWLNPELLLEQVKQLRMALNKKKLIPNQKSYRGLESKIQRLKNQWLALVPRLKGAILISNHPAYQYLAKFLKIDIHAFDFSPNEIPQDDVIDGINNFLEQHNVTSKKVILLWEAPPTEKVKNVFNKYGNIQHLTISPLEKPPRNKSIFEIWEKEIITLEKALK